MEVGLRKFAWILGLVTLLSGCATELVGDSAELGQMEFPTGMVIHPNGRYAYVVGSNFDLDYRATDGGAVYVVDLQDNKILPTSKRMGSFGTNIVLSSDARHGFTVTRDDDALVWFEISEDGSNIFCPNAEQNSDTLLDCRVIVDNDPTHVAITHSYREVPQINADGQTVKNRVDFDLLVIAHMRNAAVTAMTVQQDPEGTLSFSHQSASLVYTASEVLWISGERFVVTGRAADNLVVVSPAIDSSGSVLGVYARETLTVPNAYGAYQGRGMTLDPTGKKLYLINQYPNSLLQFDVTGIAHNDMATDKAQVTQMMILPNEMSKIAWIGDENDGMLYLTSVSKNAIYIVDPRKMEIESVLNVGQGPYELLIEDKTVYVLHFSGNDIWVLDASDPLHPQIKSKLLTPPESAPEQSGN